MPRNALVLAVCLASACYHPEPPTPMAASDTQQIPSRSGLIRDGQQPLTLWGPALEIGATAPNAVLRTLSNKPIIVSFNDGIARIVTLVPSLDTNTCSLVAQTFGARVSQLGHDVEVMVVSRDLPHAQRRFCSTADMSQVFVLSDFDTGAFGESWGLMVEETRLLAHAVVVVDGNGKVAYVQLVEDQRDEPDYDAAVRALAKIVPPSLVEEEELVVSPPASEE